MKKSFLVAMAAFALAACEGIPTQPLPDGAPPSQTEISKYPEAPRNAFADLSFEAATKLCFRQPNYPMCALDCIERPERQPWNDWCDMPPAPADKVIDPSQYTDEELLAILQEDFY